MRRNPTLIGLPGLTSPLQVQRTALVMATCSDCGKEFPIYQEDLSKHQSKELPCAFCTTGFVTLRLPDNPAQNVIVMARQAAQGAMR